MNCRDAYIRNVKILFITVLTLLFAAVFSLYANCTEFITPSASFDSGDGSESDPYVIKTPAQLKFFADAVNDGETFADKYIALGADITFNDPSDFSMWGTVTDNVTYEPQYSWQPAGDSVRTYFAGTFDGAHHTITGLYINSESDYLGLLGCIDGGTVQNLSLEYVYIAGGYNVGAVAGELVSGRVENCRVDGKVAGIDSVGGIVGSNGFTGTVASCLSLASVTASGDYAEARVGALVGSGNAPFNSYYLIGENNANGSGVGLTSSELASRDVAFLLNTDGVHTSTAACTDWSHDGTVPVFASDKYTAVSKFTGEYSHILPDVSGYDSTSSTYYIENAAQLLGFSRLVNSGADDFSGRTVVLSRNIFYSFDGAEKWEPVGVYCTDEKRCFRGTFDGGGLIVYGLYTDTSCSYSGLFGYTENSVIKNVTVMGSDIFGAEYTGAVAGRAYNTTVELCRNLSSVDGYTDIGGICGSLYGDGFSLTRCFNNGSVGGVASVGGICGLIYGADVKNSYNSGSVGGSYNYVGGVAGETDGQDGITGQAGTVESCYNSGKVTSDAESSGAIVGLMTEGTLQNVYALENSADKTGGAKVLSADNMTLPASFVGFDFDIDSGEWTMDGDADYKYPELAKLRHINDEKIILGDVDRNGKINLFDIIALRILISKGSLYDVASDVNADGKLTNADMTVLSRFLLGRPDCKTLPCYN